jgi:hypothetical protein
VKAKEIAPAPAALEEEVFPRADKLSAHDRRSAEARAIEQKRLAAVAARTADLRALREARDAKEREARKELAVTSQKTRKR